jgi:choline dehydrogenase-like flavoprotein
MFHEIYCYIYFMKFRGPTIPDGEILKTDVCIIGAGPAGLAIAAELQGWPHQVVLLESGAFPADTAGMRDETSAAFGHGRDAWNFDDFQQLNLDDRMPTGDVSYPSAVQTRIRRFGGTSNSWSIRYTPSETGIRYTTLDPIDFEKRDWVPHSGWPFTKSHLDPYYARAHAFAGAGPYDYAPETWSTPKCEPYPFENTGMETRIFHFGPSRTFLAAAKAKLAGAPNITLITEATATELLTSSNCAAVTDICIKTLAGTAFRIRPKIVIIASGTIEATRLLLCSRQGNPAGLGNQNDLVGRFLMDHQAVRSGHLRLAHPDKLAKLMFYDTRRVDGALITAKSVLTEETLREKKLLNTCAAIFPRRSGESTNPLRKLFPRGPRHNSPAVGASVALLRALRARKIGPAQIRQAAVAALGIVDVLYYRWRKDYGMSAQDAAYHLDSGGWSVNESDLTQFPALEVLHLTEQVPDRDNRITLGMGNDALGMTRICQHWCLTDTDLRGVAGALHAYKAGFAKAGIGDLDLELNQGAPQVVYASLHHPMGTTRMHDDPKQGVVDARCRVHGTENCYIAAASVFPTGGYANATLTVLALAIRIADDVKAQLKH